MGDFPRLSVRHLLGISELHRDDITTLFRTASIMKEKHLRQGVRNNVLAGKTIVNLFAENSTRTRSSFELAERRLGADILNFSSDASSFSKGETLLDTVWNVEAMHVDAIVVRHSAAGAAHFLAERCTSVFLNAGDGRHEHPTQALLDTFTLHEQWNDPSTNDTTGFEGKRVTIVGDVAHGRVALSNIYALQKLGAEVAVCGPPTLIPQAIRGLGVNVFYKLEAALEYSDALIMLRMQRERQQGGFVPSLREYAQQFGLAHRELRRYIARKDILVLHPGPINRGIELDSETADGPHSLILRQVENGVAIRMAVLAHLLSDA